MTVEDKNSPPGANRPATACSNRKPDEDAVAVRVAVHIRPLVEQELAKGCQEVLDVTPATAQIQVGQHTFTYDNVYGSPGGTDAVSLYPDCVQPLVDGLFKGYNATVFAYGQTGSGKTYTMGSSWSADMENQGVIPCVMDEMFSRMDAATNTDFTVKVSFVEIHKEEVRDLLWTNAAAPRPVVTIRELPSGVTLAGACERLVNTREDMSHVLMQGTLMRAVASTNMNSRSSRSHAIFTITLEQRRRQLVRPASAPPAVDYTPGGTAINAAGSPDSTDTDTSEEEEEEEVEAGDEYFIAKMHLVDLAGSERAKRTGAQGARLKEAININKGLLALAKVITALVENQSHIPYRDSKLTRLLQDSLGGNSRTVMIACVSPADINREESLNTLRYADRARRIKNKPVVNRDPVAAQLSALRQQIASLRAENSALKNALGGDAAAMAVFANRGQTVASEALQEAYDDLAVRCNALEVGNARQNMELDQAHDEIKLLRSGLLHAETERDQVMLRMEALQQALAASCDETVKTALSQDAAAAAAATAAAASPRAKAAEDAEASPDQQKDAGQADASAVSSSETAAVAATAVAGNMGVIAILRARVLEVETELRQARSLQRMTSSVIARGMSAGGGLGSRAASTTRMSNGGKPNRPTEAHHLAMQTLATATGGVTVEEEDLDPCSPLTPARPVSDELDEPLMEVESDAEVLAQSAAHMVAREAMALKLAVLGRQMEAKQKRLAALQGAADIEGAKTKYMLELQKERDKLAKEKTELMKKLQAVEAAGAEERKKLEQQYRDKLNTVEKRLKDLAEKEKAAKRSAAQLGRVQSVCQQLQADISRMKSARAAVQRRMEAKEKEFREWRLLREREVLQLRRNAQRQNAALQQHQAMHSKQQAVLKRKTEEAEAARRKLRDLLELQAKAKKDRKGSSSLAIDEKGVPIEMELQPNATAPLLRTEKARRDWLEQELEMCTTSWQYQKVLEGELAQRAEATRKLREVQKQLMLLGGLVPPSPVVTAAAAAAAAANRGVTAAAAAAKAALPREEVLQQDAARLQSAMDRHSTNIKELQEQWERARNDEQSRGAGAADVRRWTGIRNIVEARELLRTLFVSACSQKAQMCEGQMEHAKLQEAADILQIKLDMAVQQAAEARRKALEAEATTAAVLTTPAHIAAGTGSDSDDGHDVLARRLVSSVSRQESSSGRTAAAAAAIAAAAAASRHEAGMEDILGQFGSAPGGTADSQDDHRDEIDIEADDLLHSMGLPPIMEMPSPAHTSAELPGSRVLSHSNSRSRFNPGSGQDPNTRYQALVKSKYGSWRAPPSNSTAAAGGGSNSVSRAGSSNLGVLQGQPSSESLRDRLSVDDVSGAAGPSNSAMGGHRRPEKSGSLGLGQVAQDLAAKLDALEENWKGYKRNAAAGGTRRSMTGATRQGRTSYGSLPGSPTASAVGSIGMSYGKPGSALRESLQLGPPAIADDAARVRASLSACNSPVNGLLQPAGAAGRTAGFWPHQQEQEGPETEQEDLADAPVAVVAKELNFMDAEADTTPVREDDGEPVQQQSSPNTRAAEHMGSKRQRPGRRKQEVEPLQPVDSHRTRQSSVQRQHEQQQQQGDIGSHYLDDADSDASDDDEDDDPSYDPAIHGTPAVAHRGGRRASRNSKARNSRLSAGCGEGQQGSSATTSARVAGRWGTRDNPAASTSRPNSGLSTAASAFSSATGSSRSLAAQVSFNHEKRRGWEKPVLEDINTQRAGQGFPSVDKLTIQLLKDCMVGKELDGKQWVAGAKTRDNLIAEYRRMMHLGEETDIDRITGAATWSMPSSLTSSGEDSPSGDSPGGWRRRRAKDGSRSLRRSDSMGPALNAAGGARRFPANLYQLDTQNLPSSAPASNSPSPTRRMMHSVDGSLNRNSPQRIGLAAAGRIRAGSPPSSASGGKGDSDNNSRAMVSQSLDCRLLTAVGGAQRVPGSPVQAGALQESAQRSVQKSSSQKPMRLNIPASRVDGPYSCRLPSSLSAPLDGPGGLELKYGQQTDRSNSRQGQPSWR